MSELKPEIIQSLNTNYATMLNNFSKIGSWFKSGTESPHELPQHIVDFLDTHAKKSELLDKLAQGYNNQNKVIKQLQADLAEAKQAEKDAFEARNYLANRLDKLEKSLQSGGGVTIDKGEDKPEKEAPAKKTTAKKETKAAEKPAKKATTKKEDELALTAEAVDAGDVSEDALAALDAMADDLSADMGVLDAL